jgi:hypothetical protein
VGDEAQRLGEKVGARLWEELLTVVGELEEDSATDWDWRTIVDATVETMVSLASSQS